MMGDDWQPVTSATLDRERWPRWHGIGDRDGLFVEPNTIMSPDRFVRARWRYGTWLDLLARAGGYFHRQYWDEHFGGGHNAAANAWSECHDLRVIRSGAALGSGADCGIRPAIGWLTRAGWYVVERYGLPPVVRAPVVSDPQVAQGLCLLDFTFSYHMWVSYRRGADADEPAPSAFLDEAAQEYALPARVVAALRSDMATDSGRVWVCVGRLWAAAGDPHDHRTQLYVVDTMSRREPRETVRWLLNLQSVLSLTDARDIEMMVITPSEGRATWWRDNERLWAANQWPPTRLSIGSTEVERLLTRG